MMSDTDSKDLTLLDQLSEGLRKDLEALDEILELYQQEAIALETLESERRELLVDLEYGEEGGLQRVLAKIKASFGLK